MSEDKINADISATPGVSAAAQAVAKQPKHRSPSYPAFDLEVAVERARQLWNVANRHAINVGAAIECWGYSPKSSTGKLLIAALKKFGLADDEGSLDSRRVSLTELGRRLVVLGRDDEEWALAAREAVFLPAIHRELWEKYDSTLPSAQVVTPYLVLERGFSTQAAGDLVAEFRSSLDFAGISQTQDGRDELANPDRDYDFEEPDDELDGVDAHRTFIGDYLSPNRAARVDEQTLRGLTNRGSRIMEPASRSSIAAASRRQSRLGRVHSGAPEGHRSVSIPYSAGEWAELQAPFPISEPEFESLISMLQAMKPGLVAREGSTPPGSGGAPSGTAAERTGIARRLEEGLDQQRDSETRRGAGPGG